MSKTAIVERSGILLHVTYDVCPEETVTFYDIRALGVDYQPCGPNLLPLLDSLLVLHDDDAQPGEEAVAERLLSTFLNEVSV